jgi:hypothetical protein
MGLKRDDARGIHEDDGTRGIAWEIENYQLATELIQNYRASGGVVKHKHFERYLKEGLRSIAEIEDPEILDFQGLYQDTVPTAWWFELLGYSSRIGYSIILMFPPNGSQELAGALLSGCLVASTAYFRPYRRPSDTLMQMAANISLLAFFVVHDRDERRRLLQGSVAAVTCLCFPTAMLLYWMIKAYVLPSRKKLWAEEEALMGFHDEFQRQWFAEKEADPASQAAVLRGSRAPRPSIRGTTSVGDALPQPLEAVSIPMQQSESDN